MNNINKNNQITVGIWIEQVQPHLFRGEGITRLLAFIIRAAQRNDNVRIVIACAGWVEKSIRFYLRELDIDDKRIDFIVSSRKMPLLLKIHQALGKKKKKKKGLFSFNFIKSLIKSKILKSALSYFFKKMVSVRSWWAGVLILPLILVFIAISGLLGLFYILITVFKLLFNNRLSKKVKNVLRKGNSVKSIKTVINKNKYSNLIYKLVSKVTENEFDVLAKKASRRMKNVDCWYIPHPGWAHSLKLNKPLVVAVPDLVYLDFPTKFPDIFMDNINKKIRELVPKAHATISYSDYVKELHVVKQFSYNPEKAYVIPHAPIETNSYLEKLLARTNLSFDTLSTRIIQNYLSKLNRNNPLNDYVRQLPIKDIPYLFISSQVRPHKNFLNFFKAYEILLRRKYRNIKLIVTGAFNEELVEFVDNRKLQLDILSLPQLPPRVHAAFYARATLNVVPTLFEGGFPFVFSESLSVRTPVVMSSIPVTLESVPQRLAEFMLFDPYNINDMVDKIEMALDNRENLLNDQLKLFEEMSSRTWDQVGDEYIEVFEKVGSGLVE